MSSPFRESRHVRESLESLHKLFEDYGRGDLVSAEIFEDTSGYCIDGGIGGHIWRRFKREFLERRRIALRWKQGHGPYLMTCTEQIEDPPQGRQKRALKQVQIAATEVEAVKNSEVGLHYQRLRAFALADLAKNEQALASSVKSIASSLKTETNPLRPIGESLLVNESHAKEIS